MTSALPPRSYDELEQYLPYLVNRLASLGQVRQNRMLQESGITLVTLRALSILHIEEGLTINEIAARAFTEQSSTSRAIDAMVSQGLVERRTPEHDQRRREVVLTEMGRERLLGAWPAMDRYFDTIIQGITPAERDMCRSIIQRMLANLDNIAS